MSIKTIVQTLITVSTCFSFPLTCAAETASTPTRSQATQKWAFSLAMQAAAWGAPIVTMYTLRYSNAFSPQAKVHPNEIWRVEDITTPEISEELGYVTPNVNVIYGFGFMDLRQEPIVLEAPDSNNLYYMVEIVDMWTNAFAYVGGQATGYKGGKYALVGPNWKGTLPAGITRIDCPTPWVLIQPRVHIYDKGRVDLNTAKRVLDAITVMGLSEFTKKQPLSLSKYDYPVPRRINPDLPVSALDFKDPLQFWELLAIAMNENPPPQDQITALLPMFAPLGLELGKPWDRSKVPPQILAAMGSTAKQIGDLLARMPFGTLYKGALLPPPNIGNTGADYATRAVVARVGLTANTPSETVYWMHTADSEGQPLSGAKKYTMTFTEAIPFFEPGFWSITMYDAYNNYTVSNPINRYMLGSDTRKLQKNPDGSFILYIQKESPGKDKETNWLPAPAGSFYLISRSYAPKPQIIRLLSDVNAWPIPTVKLQSSQSAAVRNKSR